MTTTPRRSGVLAPIASLAAVALAVSVALAQPSDITYPRYCDAGQCTAAGSTSVICDTFSDQGCCCKLPGQSAWECQCKDPVTCLTSPNCHANSGT